MDSVVLAGSPDLEFDELLDLGRNYDVPKQSPDSSPEYIQELPVTIEPSTPSSRRSQSRSRARVDYDANKNARAAKLNRERHKQYLQNLEQNHVQLQADKAALANKNDALQRDLEAARKQIAYLQSVITSSGAIADLIKSVSAAPGVTVDMPATDSSDIAEHPRAKRGRTSEAGMQQVIPIQFNIVLPSRK